ncbi:hypothetical protein M2350_000085 [Candidatus Fervidibacter sacchari]|uniref:Uncharacterized protein n=1 Tax=Candidatus Fervidibacter sacchari TaxID=1448929 RepID=A0ABT2EIB4_9BACT|nr:hypothetical protein [Candidatus Fervidibacter sacchari]
MRDEVRSLCQPKSVFDGAVWIDKFKGDRYHVNENL